MQSIVEFIYYYLILVTTVSSPLVEVDNIVNNMKKEQRNLHFARRQITPNRQILKNTARDVTYTQFAVIDDDNLSAIGQITKGGGGKNNCCLILLSY